MKYCKQIFCPYYDIVDCLRCAECDKNKHLSASDRYFRQSNIDTIRHIEISSTDKKEFKINAQKNKRGR